MSSQSYFTKQSEHYDERLKSGLLGKVRNAEKIVVLKALNPQNTETILDIPCGSGYYADYIKETGAEVYGVDISPEMIGVFRNKGYSGEVGDLETFSLYRTFDKILSAGGFEFCKNHRQIMMNLTKHVKKEGIIVLLVPRKSFFGLLYQLYHRLLHKSNIILFSKKDLNHMMQGMPLKCIKIRSCSLFSWCITLKKE